MDFLASVVGRMSGFLYRCRADEYYTMIEMTDGIERVFGYPRSELIGNKTRTFASIIHPDDADAVDRAVNTALADHTNWSIEYRIQPAKGDPIWVSETGGGVWDKEGELTHVEGSVLNIQSLYTRLDDRAAEMTHTVSKMDDVMETLRFLKLLAINAGIEAARAGSSGAGFAFLASEMRALADKSERITTEITRRGRQRNGAEVAGSPGSGALRAV